MRFTRWHDRLLAHIPGTPQHKRLPMLNKLTEHWYQEHWADKEQVKLRAQAMVDKIIWGKSDV